MDINGFYGPKNIRKSLLLADLKKMKKSKMASAAILKMASSWTMLTLFVRVTKAQDDKTIEKLRYALQGHGT